VYDFIIIGAGSAGAHTAFFLAQKGAKVAVVEREVIGAGGSGAAGAFVTPRLGKGGVIQRWSNEAFKFAISFYKSSPHFFKTQLLRIPKEGEEFEKFKPYLQQQGIEFKEVKEGFLFPQAGVIKAKEHLKTLLEKIEVIYQEGEIKFKGNFFEIGKLQAKEVVLASGSELKIPYVKIGRVAGVRFDLFTPLSLPYSLHKKVSLSAKIEDRVVLGATHQRLDKNCSFSSPLKLFQEAKAMVGEFEYFLAQMYCGVRSSVDDHLPILGSILNLESLKLPLNHKKLDISKLPRSRLHVVGGLGGRGFVFGPFVGEMMSSYLLEEKQLPDELNLNRYLKRFIKRQKSFKRE